ncbi:choice-of-anchor A family protein [Bacillus albus]|uniref:SpaA isopeptide-forming pilin-related protein n=1 Tax=Bacillus albus TaxID=2026189 RepID=UPI001009B7F4|nr:SpaA isopeptide-forming pilin-related protein [Bacillus albus]RXJ21385.1 choice-of-anchor A family protein [Bacillus albus]RXJ27301.1 choice-of-anchor A family protein [Bacillus albus]RXJ30136.1 choice-of-anchor A family protein [Bacillus albus]RXJ41355.1 choice-of-anchor A family protein [Bacillus albus]RXJ58275.1 choice-of-anchor A family protein [Bacillus albus]
MRKSFNQKIKKLSSSFIVVLLVCMNFLIHLPYKAEAATTELKGLGDVSYYNAIIFGDHSATSADIEGAMAVQKNMNASSYTVVAAATGANNLAGAKWVDEGYPSLLLGGQFTKAGAGQVIIQDGTVAMTKDGDPEGAMKSSYDRISYKEQAEIDAKFKEFRKDVNSVIEDAGQLHTDKPKPGMTFGIGEDVNNSNIYVSSGLEGQEPFNVKDVYLPNVNNKDFIVIHSDAEEVNFGGGAILYDTTDKGGFTLVNTSQAYDPNSFFTELASKVIWVFPNAKKITTKGYGVVGSVFAPNAVVETKGGSINGQAFVGGLHQRDGFEVHNFKFNWPKWKKPAAEKGNLQIKKVDEDNENIVLKDAKFDVIDKDNNVVATVTTNEKGIAEVKDLPFGDYFVKEISAPEGYIKVDTPAKVTIDNTNIIEFVMKNTKKVENGQFKLLKKDSESGQLLPGAKFDVIDKDGNVVETIITDGKGEALSKQLPVGTYTLKEVEAPKGYELSSSLVHVDVAANNTVTVDVLNKKIVEKVTGQFEIVKVDAEDKAKVLSDAEFEVYKDGKKVETLRTDKTGKVISKKLEPGTYTLKETKAPQGYKLLKEEIEVVVEANKVVEVQVENAKELGSLQVIKKDAESGKVLEGAEFRLKNENGQVVGEAKTTNKDGVVQFENLVPGKYTLEETKAPEGYKTVEVKVEVNIAANEVAKQEVLNEKVKEKIKGQVEITKVDANDKDKKLAGAVFEILKDGAKIDTLTSDENGKATSKELEPGDYVLKEVQAPEGYELSGKEIEFTISNQKIEVVKLQITNEKETSKGPENPGGETETPGGETETPGGETETPGGETETPGGETETPGGETETPGGETETPGGETETPGGETETPGGETETPGGETETPGGETEKPGGETEKPGGETEKPGGETEKPGGETEKPGGETETPGGETETPGGETETPGGETETPGGETETPGGETEMPGGETEKPGGETETSGGETEKPGGETETSGGETEKPGEETEKPGEGTETSGEEVGKPNLPEKEQGSSNNQKLPATGHNTNYLPFIGVILLLLGMRLRFMTKNG